MTKKTGKRIVRIIIGWFIAVSLTSFIYARWNWTAYTKVWRIAALWYCHLIILVPGIYWITRKMVYEKMNRYLFFFFHLVAAVMYGVLNTTFAFLDLHIYYLKDISDYLHRMYPQYFNISIVAYAAIAGWFYLVQYIRQSRINAIREANLKKLATEAELKALKAQINPHFLFNTLHSVNALMSQSTDRAREVIARLSDIFRHTLEGSKKELVPLSQELQFTRDYLEIEKIRLGERLLFDIQTDAASEKIEVPPIILQPLVENAVIHGIAPRKEGGKITVSVTVSGEWIRFQIADTGNGMDPGGNSGNPAEGTGMHNTFERLKMLYPDSFEQTVSQNTPRGCIVSLKFKYRSGGK